ncbi:Tat pathway signal sequence domain protein [Lentzea sp. BCCO 10_0061]|uniref:Tat pathway signal sequence domain protein n=1 Tax=Lentzea sokolovensis TaxID=3095429 RepID=A0ABU4VC87_9PSEU|nr:Tat pathway signal sequence domain protein [Lentzea sp. BCCO 10_0061]MDX8149406.1 Tat pathway signal sequence domain protein [Lentzea sp. BCCO 10_0061]
MELSRRGLMGGVVAGAALTALPAGAEAETSGYTTRIDWERFLGEQDLVWQRIPRAWYEGPFLGNGFLATAVYREPGANAVRFTVDHAKVQDHRPQFGNEWGVARLPVGRLLLTPVGQITGVDLRLDLWNAELRGKIVTDRGELAIRLFVHAEKSLLHLEVRPTGGERAVKLEFQPLDALSPRTIREPPPATFPLNPKPVSRTVNGLTLVTQEMVAGGQTATAHRTRERHGRTDLLLSVEHSFPDRTAEATVRTAITTALAPEVLRQQHQRWWHRFYRKSFVSVPDALMQSFYWIQLYKLASGARREAPIMPTSGPWLEPTPWPSVWFNLNAQLEYWPVLASNHLELDPIPRTISQHQQILVDALRPEFRADSMGLRRSTDPTFQDAGFVGSPLHPSPDPEIGNLPWLLHNAWLHYRHSMDERILRDTVFPVLRRSTNYYLHFLRKGDDGRLHLLPTYSPEYGVAPDCNYDLALLRWSCRTLVESAKILKISDPLAARWQEVLDQLVDHPTDAGGFMIGAGVPFAKSHRHYSHLLAVYPLHEVTWEQPERRDLIERSLKHWLSFEGSLRGFTFTGAASIAAQMTRGDDALGYLREFVARFAQPNTMYFEAGPVIETPLSAAKSLQDMLVQSWGGLIRIFPAVPSGWRDVTIHDTRTEGAFLVSAVRRGGRTRFVRVLSEAGQPCRVRTGIDGPLIVRGCSRWSVRDGVVELGLRRGQEALIHAKGERDFTIAPVRITSPGRRWGLPALPPGGSAVPVDISASFDNDGLSNEFTSRDGDFDGLGDTYPAAQLPQTGSVTDDGVLFEFHNGDEASRNNTVASGQTLAVPAGKYGKLHLLAAADTGNVEADGAVVYADGAVPARFRVTAWQQRPQFGESEPVATTLMHTPSGPVTRQVSIFHQFVELDAARELSAVTLPRTSGPRLHVFAITLEKPK